MNWPTTVYLGDAPHRTTRAARISLHEDELECGEFAEYRLVRTGEARITKDAVAVHYGEEPLRG